MGKKKSKKYTMSKIHPEAKVEYRYHKIFGYIRTAVIDGVTWYSINDICKSLGYKRSNNVAYKYLNDDYSVAPQYVLIKTTHEHKTRLRMIPPEEVIIFLASVQKKSAKAMLKWILSEANIKL